VADYIAVNLSSPNTPGLRDLQNEDACARLLERLKVEQARLTKRHGRTVPLLFKVAPDLEPEHIRGLSKVFLDGGLDGLIATNTTITRDGVEGHARSNEAGGLSGKPLTERSTRIIQAFADEFGGKIPIIGAGGISSADDAVDKIKAGAALVQVYSAFIYQGPALIREIADRLDEMPV
jgi:dihydroorotate dehydrogenase